MFASLKLLVVSLAALSLPLAFAAHGPARRQHNEIAKRHDNSTLNRRASGVRATYYDVQTGNQVMCGGFRNNGEAIVAMALGRMSSDPSLCGKGINIHYGGKTVYATVADGCEACPWDGLDLTIGLFQQIADLGAGVIALDWEFVGAAPPPPPPPTSVWVPPTPSPTPTPTPSSSSVRPSSSSASPSSSSAASSAQSSGASSSAAPTPTSNFQNLYQAFAQYGGVAAAGNHY